MPGEKKDEKKGSDTDIEKTEILYGSDKIVKRAIDDFQKIKERFDNCTDSTGPSVFFNTPIWKEFANLSNRGIKLRFITEITKDNVKYCKELTKITDLRHLDGVKGNFGISDGKNYGGSASVKEGQPPTEIMRSNVRTFVEQQQFFFETLWIKAIPAETRIKEIEEGIEPALTQVLQNQQEIFNATNEFYKKSNQIKSCFAVEGLNILNRYFFSSRQEILERYRQGKHKGIRWITSLNNKKEAELVKGHLAKGIEVRHVKDVSANSFTISDKAFLFTIEKIEEGKIITNVLSSNDKLYLDHYDSIFEGLWKKGIDIQDRIKDIEEGYNVNVQTIPNTLESLKLSKKMLETANHEILLIAASSSAFFRIEKNIGYRSLERLAQQNVKVRILIPSKIDIQDKIHAVTSKYPKIEFRTLQISNGQLVGVTIIDRQRVLIFEVKDDNKSSYLESVGMTIHIEGKSTAISYATIFDCLWKQTDLYSEIRKSYDSIRIHDKMQRDFINVAAHELRTPIQPILGFTEQLKSKIADREQLGFLDIIYRNTKRLKKLSEDILDVSKIDSNLLNLNKKKFRIKELVQQIVSDHKKEAETKYIEFELLDPDKNDLFVYADMEKISQVMANLISNSIKFIPVKKGQSTGNISISVQKMSKNGTNRDDSNMIKASFKDNGAGIDKDVLPILFTKFASKSFQGTGLGLYICKNIIEAHGGRIWAENNEDGKGATFSFSLPSDT